MSDLFQKIVHDGILEPKGMVAFGSLLQPKSIELIRAYVTHRVNESVAEAKADWRRRRGSCGNDAPALAAAAAAGRVAVRNVACRRQQHRARRPVR